MRKLLLLLLAVWCLTGCTHTRAVHHFLSEGTSGLDNKEYEKAYSSFSQGLESYPDNEKLFYDKALASALTGRYEEAIVMCDQGYKRWPNLLRFLKLKYQTYMKMEDARNAIIAMDEVLKLTPSDTTLRLELMEYAMAQGFPSEARFHAEFLIDNRKETAKAYETLSLLDGEESDAAKIAAYLSKHASSAK